jgi:geranylgeranylglycerol-phosphate geranylgeranyltransferase
MKGFFLLSRPVNVLIAMLSIFLAAVIAAGLVHKAAILLACLTGALVTAAANSINDYFDVEIDRINRPERPIPAGLVSRPSSLKFSFVCYALALLTSAAINGAAFFIAVAISVLMYFYSSHLKRTVLFGNVTVSFASAMAFIFGGVAVGNARNAVFPAIFAFLMHLGREIVKDMEDVEGDKKENAWTLPVRYGLNPARWLATIILAVLFVVTFLPFHLRVYGRWYLVTVLIGVNSVIVFAILALWTFSRRNTFRRLSALLKADMLIGLLAIYVGKW